MGRAEERQARQRGARRAKKAKPTGIRRFFTWRKLLGTFFGLCLLVMGAFFVIYLMVPVPEANAQAEMQSNVYKFSNGKVLTRTGKINREIVGLDNIPKDVQDTLNDLAKEWDAITKRTGVDQARASYANFLKLTGSTKRPTAEAKGTAVKI